MKSRGLSPELQTWVEARARHHLSHAHVQMARELGMNPKKLGKIDNHRQEPWKMPLPLFLEHLYEKRFGRTRPERVLSIEDLAKDLLRRKAERRQRKLERRQANAEPRGPVAESTGHLLPKNSQRQGGGLDAS